MEDLIGWSNKPPVLEALSVTPAGVYLNSACVKMLRRKGEYVEFLVDVEEKMLQLRTWSSPADRRHRMFGKYAVKVQSQEPIARLGMPFGKYTYTGKDNIFIHESRSA